MSNAGIAHIILRAGGVRWWDRDGVNFYVTPILDSAN